MYCLETSPDSTHNDQLGDNIDAGLPNITGTFSDSSKPNTDEPWTFIDGGDLVTTGAIKKYSSINGSHRAVREIATTNGGSVPGFQFDASLSNAIYGNSDNVQPPAVKTTMWQRIA